MYQHLHSQSGTWLMATSQQQVIASILVSSTLELILVISVRSQQVRPMMLLTKFQLQLTYLRTLVLVSRAQSTMTVVPVCSAMYTTTTVSSVLYLTRQLQMRLLFKVKIMTLKAVSLYQQVTPLMTQYLAHYHSRQAIHMLKVRMISLRPLKLTMMVGLQVHLIHSKSFQHLSHGDQPITVYTLVLYITLSA